MQCVFRFTMLHTGIARTLQHYHPDPDHTPEDHHALPEYEGPLEEHPLWQRDNVELTSVGIDIGSAGTQVLFSRVLLQRQSVDLSTRYLVVERETLFQSPVSLTPYAGDRLIDARALGEIVDRAYAGARLMPDDIDTGVVILTGEALRRENARPIATILSEKCGDLVCASAGHHMEATLAAHGSGAVQTSFERGLRLLNIDMGGGTTKLSVIDKGRIVSTAALHVGCRLIAYDAEMKLVRVEPAGRLHAARAGLSWEPGTRVTEAEVAAVAESMADDLVAALTMPAPPADVLSLYLTDAIGDLGRIDAVIVSGGVAEFVYRREERDFGDLGKRLGDAIRHRLDDGRLPWPLLPESQGIRATALGCSEFTAQLSGNTGYISDPERLLPRRNLTVLRPEFDFTDRFRADDLADAIRRHIARFGPEHPDADIVLAIHWRGTPSYRRLQTLADGIRAALADRIERGRPVYVILNADIALNLGAILHRDIGTAHDVMVIDGLELWDFDSIDIGRLRQPSMTVPVTIKSLIFSDVRDGARRRERISSPAARG
jgi:ethanolamine utilization protein EutA